MKSILFFTLLFSATVSYGQSQPGAKRVNQAISAIEKGECILIFYEEHFANAFEKKQFKELEVISQLNFEALDSLFMKNTNSKVKLSIFYVLCKKYRPQITEKHLNEFKTNQEVVICNGRNTEKGPLNQITAYLYKNSVERKEKITNPEAKALLIEAQELEYNGPVDFELMIKKLDEANQLEPNNPIILDALAHAKFDSKIDTEGALIDFQQAITYSLDQSSLEIRHLNRGVSLMDMGDIESACEDWKKAGDHGLSYLDQYCRQSFDAKIYENPDNDLLLKLDLIQDTAFITSSHNSPKMSDCDANSLLRT